MTKSAKYLDLVKKKHGLKTDYALAQYLDLSRAKISNFRTGFRAFDDITLYKVADSLGINPALIHSEINLEKANTPEKKQFWKRTYSKIAGTAAGVILSCSMLAHTPEQTGISGADNQSIIYIMRTLTGLAALIMVMGVIMVSPLYRSHLRAALKRSTFTALGSISLLSPVYADAWSTGDTYREWTYQAIHFIDYRQTVQISKSCDQYEETNPFLNRCPSRASVDKYFLATGLLHAGLSAWLPVKFRGPFQYVTIGISSGSVMNNYRVGIKIPY
ncbi:MAG: DUF3693 domain-containing protein [Gammaproteobacteria bacterium]|nr:DUF3693 domain-containing protein [Gammaproteobacteria bacterium]